MEVKTEMSPGEFGKLIQEIQVGTYIGQSKQYLRKKEGTEGFELTFGDAFYLTKKQQEDLADELISDLKRHPNNSILAQTDLPADNANALRDKLLVTLQEDAADHFEKVGDAKDSYNTYFRSVIGGLLSLMVGAGVVPIIGITLAYLGVAAAFPPLLGLGIAFGVIGAIAIGVGILAKIKLDEKKEGYAPLTNEIGILREVNILKGHENEWMPKPVVSASKDKTTYGKFLGEKNLPEEDTSKKQPPGSTPTPGGTPKQ